MSEEKIKLLDNIVQESRSIGQKIDIVLHDIVVSSIYNDAGIIASKAIKLKGNREFDFDRNLDRILTSKWLGFPIMLIILAGVFYLTIAGANIPSQMLASMFFSIEDWMAGVLASIGTPEWITGLFIHGVFKAVAWVISVMLPPMAIFFPVFTLLEDFGYLPRIAFNLDRLFKWAGAHGKQALTMGMGFGCNAAGIVSTRIIDSPRERLIAILTNNFVPCNGRWPLIIILATVFVAGSFTPSIASVAAVGVVMAVTLLGIAVTLLVSKFLSGTVLKGELSSYQLELPSYRKPQILRVLYTSFISRTIFVLWRAIIMAAPAGAVIWLLGNIYVGDTNLMTIIADFLKPFGNLIGLDGVIILAYIIAIPANEIVIPTIIMGYMASGQMMEVEDLDQLKNLFLANGWTIVTAVCLMLFSLLHYPCSTTTLSIWKETKSIKWTVLSNLLPLTIAILVCFVVAQVGRLLL